MNKYDGFSTYNESVLGLNPSNSLRQNLLSKSSDLKCKKNAKKHTYIDFNMFQFTQVTFIAYIDIPPSEVGYTRRMHPQDSWTKSNHPTTILHKSQTSWKHPWNSQNETEISEIFFHTNRRSGRRRFPGYSMELRQTVKLSLHIVSTFYFGIGYIFVNKWNIKSTCCISIFRGICSIQRSMRQWEQILDLLWTSGVWLFVLYIYIYVSISYNTWAIPRFFSPMHWQLDTECYFLLIP